MRYKIWSPQFFRIDSLMEKYGEALAPFSPQIDDTEGVTIELSSLEDLTALIKAVGNDIVIDSDNTTITIYDDWLE